MRLDELEAELRSERSEMREEFGRELDEWAAAGFPRGERPGRERGDEPSGIGAWLAGLWSSLTLGGVVGSVGALAATVAVIAVVVSVDGGRNADEASMSSGGAVEQETSAEPEAAAPMQAAQDSTLGETAAGADGTDLLVPPAPTGGAALPGRENRKVERDADITLAAQAGDVPRVADGVIGVVNTHDGVVESSEVAGSENRAAASFELSIPARELDATIDDLGELANVAALREGSTDITGGFVTAGERVADDRAVLASLRDQLDAAETPKETAEISAQIDVARAELADSRAERARFVERARFADVSVQVITRSDATDPGASDDEGSGLWGIGDALDDAGRVLVVAGGVLLIAGAVLIPLSLILAAGWLVHRALRHRSRELALDS